MAVGLSAVLYLGISVLRQVNALDETTFDSAQWSLSQTEIEFLEYAREVARSDPDIDSVRLRFDILFSRIVTLRNAQVFAPLRDDAEFARELSEIDMFLDRSTPIIDGPDEVLLDQLDTLDAYAREGRTHIRQAAITGLDEYTLYLDRQRLQVASTTAQLTAVIIALFASLVLALIRMDLLTKRSAERGSALLQSNTRMNTIVNTALDGVLVTNAAMKIVDFSPAAEAIFQYDANMAHGLDFFTFCDVTPPDHPPLLREEAIAQLMNAPGLVTGTGHTRAGRSFPVEIAFQSANTPNGDINIAFVRDISNRKAAERELVAARDAALASEKMKSDFLATMSHEIRTPLNGMIGNMDLLGSTALSSTQQRFLDNMTTSGRMLMQQVSDVLDITQYDSGKLTLAQSVTNISDIVDDIVATQRGLAEAQETNLSWRWDGAPLNWAETDPNRLQLILMNLVGNAVKFTPGGTVTVTARHVAEDGTDRIRFEITDTGPGISPDLTSKIFDDFVTGDPSEARAVGGSGLGLGIARRFTAALGGKIGVVSALGEGSTFWVSLPMSRAMPPDPTAVADTVAAPSPMHVLVVEDNVINRNVVRDMLQADGHRVTEAVDGTSGVRLAEATQYDLILMDISMPGLDGRQAALAIISGDGASRDSPIIALTANIFAREAADYRNSGLTATVIKPLRRDELRKTLMAVQMPPDLSEPLVDLRHLAETQEVMGVDDFAANWDRHRMEVDDFISKFTAAPRLPDDTVGPLAHKIAGSAAIFGEDRLRAALLTLENAAMTEDGIAVHHIRRLLPQIWSDTQAAIADASNRVAAAPTPAS